MMRRRIVPPYVYGYLSVLMVMVLASVLFAQPRLPVTAEADPIDFRRRIASAPDGVVLPDYPLKTTFKLSARKASSWMTGTTRTILLDGDADVTIGSYGFKAKRAVIIMEPFDSPLAADARRVAIYFDDLYEWAGQSPVQQRASRLLVTASLSGPVKLSTDLLQRDSAENDPLVLAAQRRLGGYQQRLATAIQNRAAGQDLDLGLAAKPGQKADPTGAAPPESAPQPATPRKETGRIGFAAEEVNYTPGTDGADGTVTLVGDIRLIFDDRENNRQLSMTAQKAVVFLAPSAEGAGASQQFSSTDVTGVYLEGDVVASDGDYTVRAPRVFYDFANNRAVILEAVFYTWDAKRRVPIYVRAEKLRQVAEQQFAMEEAVVTTSEFFEPHFAIGVDSMTVTIEPGEVQNTYYVDAEGASVRAFDIPFFVWPSISGPVGEATPLRAVNISHNSSDGVGIETEWSLFSLLGREAPTGVDATLRIDGYTSRGFGTGIDADYDVEKAYGFFIGYFLYDTNNGNPGGSGRVSPDNEYKYRGQIRWIHRHLLPDDWEITAQIGYLSDPLFLEEFSRNDSLSGLEYETSLYAKKQVDDWAFTALTTIHLNRFPTTYATLQTPGYTVEKFPEIEYWRIGTPLFDDRVTWYSENRASVLRSRFPRTDPGDLGFNPAASMALFGIAPSVDFNDALEAGGLDEDVRIRLDSRQELQMPLRSGPVNIVPYVAGRITAYDDGFEDFSGDNDQYRLWGSVGIKLHAEFAQIYDEVEIPVFDVHRLRHIIEPRVDLSISGTTLRQGNLPVYDFDVESINQGGTIRVGMRNTLQTQRGGPGRWQSVDWIRIDTDFVFNTSDVDQESPIARYFAYRPEFSLGGDHFFGELAIQVTDTMAFIANVNHSFESGRIENWNLGLTIDHNPRLTSFAQIRSIDSLNSTIFRYGVDYVLTPKYFVGLSHAYDLDANETRDVTFTLVRAFPRWFLIGAVTWDEIGDETTIGLAIVPEGIGPRIGRGASGSGSAIERLRAGAF